MLWNFTKMHGTGNDFVVLDGVRQTIVMTPERARALSDRHFGVGADQILLVEPATVADADFCYRIYNADGSQAQHCGNGARCFVRFVHETGLSQRNPLRAQIATGILVLEQDEGNLVTVNMGHTCFDAAALPFDTAGLVQRREGQGILYTLPLPRPAASSLPNGVTQALTETLAQTLAETLMDFPATVDISTVAISNPHAVLWVEDVTRAPVTLIGPIIESHPRFPNRVNVGFMEFIDRHTIHLRVYERGAGETLACGTGACAAAATGIRQGRLDTPVHVHTRGGVLTVDWDGHTLHMSGPTASVYTGTLDIDQLVLSMALRH